MSTIDGREPEQAPASPHEGRLRALLEGLHRRTQDESLAWEVDDGHPDSYCAIGREGAWMVATRSVDGDGQAPYALVIGDPAGEPVLEVTTRSPFGRSMADLFARLHLAASAAASLASSSQLLTAIIRELDAASEPADRGRARPRPRSGGARKDPPTPDGSSRSGREDRSGRAIRSRRSEPDQRRAPLLPSD